MSDYVNVEKPQPLPAQVPVNINPVYVNAVPMPQQPVYAHLNAVKTLAGVQLVAYLLHFFFGYFWSSCLGLATAIVGLYATHQYVRVGAVRAFWLMNVFSTISEAIAIGCLIYLKIVVDDTYSDSHAYHKTLTSVVFICLAISCLCLLINITVGVKAYKLAKEAEANPPMQSVMMMAQPVYAQPQQNHVQRPVRQPSQPPQPQNPPAIV